MAKKIIFTAIILISVFIAYNLITQIFQALHSGDRLSLAAETLYKLEVENKRLKERLERIRTDEFIVEQARNKLGLVKKGETLIIIPEDKINQVLGASQSAQKQERLPNWVGWFRLFWR